MLNLQVYVSSDWNVIITLHSFSRHGTQKVLTGAALYAVGKVTNSTNLQETGGALVKLGVASKVGAHFVGWVNRITLINNWKFLYNVKMK